MRRLKLTLVLTSLVGLAATLALWDMLIRQGKRFALRDPLQKADAIVVLAGTRGNITFLNGKIHTAVDLYQQGWAPTILCCGRFSAKVADNPQLIPLEELQAAVAQGRIQAKDIPIAQEKWDTSLGAHYMRTQAQALGVPEDAILVEDQSLHTRESADFVMKMLLQHGMKQIILVTSPFHQLRTFLTFAKVMQPHGIKIVNYYADADEWKPATWFLSVQQRKLVAGEVERIKIYHEKGDL